MNKKIKIGVWSLGIAIVVVAVTFGTLAHRSAQSLPGQPLYGFKTGIVEKIVQATKLTTETRVRYDITLTEQRLQELTFITADKSTTSPELVAQIATLTNQYVNDAIATLDKNKSFNEETRITLLADLDTVTRAGETLCNSFAEIEGINDSYSESESALTNALKIAIGSFVTNNATDTVQSLIANTISEVSIHITDVAPGSKAQQLVIRRIGDTEEAITDNKFADALMAIIRARQAIAIDGYLFDSERGPIDGIPVEAGPVPEGN